MQASGQNSASVGGQRKREDARFTLCPCLLASN
jgi:hypothetical protein